MAVAGEPPSFCLRQTYHHTRGWYSRSISGVVADLRFRQLWHSVNRWEYWRNALDLEEAEFVQLQVPSLQNTPIRESAAIGVMRAFFDCHAGCQVAQRHFCCAHLSYDNSHTCTKPNVY